MAATPCCGGSVTHSVQADYLVVGTGAMGMASTDALIDHADASVALVDRRHSVGGHWLKAYPFVRLHQSSSFYGVASTVLGGGAYRCRDRTRGCTTGQTGSTICAYYEALPADRMLGSGRVEFHPGWDYLGDRTLVSGISGISGVSGERLEVSPPCRIVDVRDLARQGVDRPGRTQPRRHRTRARWLRSARRAVGRLLSYAELGLARLAELSGRAPAPPPPSAAPR